MTSDRDHGDESPNPILKCYPLPVISGQRRPRITSAFKTRNPSRPTHNGCDLFYRYDPLKDGPVKVGDGGATRGPNGTPKWFIPSGVCAIAAADGVVTLAGTMGTGRRIWVQHSDGYRTGYFHLRTLLVNVGAAVKLGEPLGEVGDNPLVVDAEHLHFEVSPNGVYGPIDPEIWLVGARYYDPRPGLLTA